MQATKAASFAAAETGEHMQNNVKIQLIQCYELGGISDSQICTQSPLFETFNIAQRVLP